MKNIFHEAFPITTSSSNLSFLHSTADYTISRVMGIYSILKALTLIQTTLYIHFKGNRFSISLFFPEIHWILVDLPSSVAVYTGCLSLMITMIFFTSEALYFRWGGTHTRRQSDKSRKYFPICRSRSTTCNFYIVFPFILNSITFAGLYYLPKKLRLWDAMPELDDENSELLRKMGTYKKRRLQSKQKSN